MDTTNSMAYKSGCLSCWGKEMNSFIHEVVIHKHTHQHLLSTYCVLDSNSPSIEQPVGTLGKMPNQPYTGAGMSLVIDDSGSLQILRQTDEAKHFWSLHCFPPISVPSIPSPFSPLHSPIRRSSWTADRQYLDPGKYLSLISVKGNQLG